MNAAGHAFLEEEKRKRVEWGSPQLTLETQAIMRYAFSSGYSEGLLLGRQEGDTGRKNMIIKALGIKESKPQC